MNKHIYNPRRKDGKCKHVGRYSICQELSDHPVHYQRGFDGPCPDCCNGTVALVDTGDVDTSEFGTCPTCHGDSRQ